MTSLTEKRSIPFRRPNLSTQGERTAIRTTGSNLTLLLSGLLGTAILAGFLILVQYASPNLAGTDGYYHIKLAQIMRSQGLKIEFPWLPLTILNPSAYYDHHLLFHAALVPFTLGDLRLGAKAASVVFAGLALLSVWWLLWRQRVPFSGLWALGLLAISEGFIYRMSMPRAQSLSLLVMVAGLQWMFSGKTWRLAALGFVYVWLYDAFPLLLALAAIYSLGVWMSERRLELRPLLYTGLGVGLGLLINPYFPQNLAFIANHLLPKLNDPTGVRVGNEWYPYTTQQLLTNSPLALVAFASGILGLGLQQQKMDARTASSLVIAIFFGVLLMQSRRFIEYFPPFALIFTALAWTPLLAGSRLPTAEAYRTRSGWRAWLQHPPRIAGLLLVALLLPGMWVTGRGAAASMADSLPYQRYQLAATWLANSTPPAALVFQTDWDDFTRLFYANTHNTYTVGLDPTYLQLADPDLYDRWVAISQGQVERPASAILGEFGARYVLTDRTHRAFIGQAAKDPAMKAVYSDQDAIVYRIDIP